MATVIAWLWARTVATSNPACKGAHVPLVKSFDLSTKTNKRAWVEPIIDNANNSYRFEIRTGIGKARNGTVSRQGGVCLLSEVPIPFSYIRSEGKAGRMGVRLMAVVVKGSRGRIYLPPTEDMETIARTAQPNWQPDDQLPNNPRDFKTPNYGMKTFSDLFTDRQLVALTTFSDLVQEARERVLADAHATGLAADGHRLADGGTGAEAYADALAVYLSMAGSKMADNNSTICTWMPGIKYEVVRNTFSRHALPMTWDFAESNPFAGSSGDFNKQVLRSALVLEIGIPRNSINPAEIMQVDAQSIHLNEKFILSTDPPYYDNIGYADLSDFFYVWMRRSLRDVFSELFQTLLVPKNNELVATPYRHHGKENAENFFLEGMKKVMRRIAKGTNDLFPSVIYYAFKQSEIEKEGVTSTGWSAFLQAVFDAGFSIVGTWPVRTERSARTMSVGTNALASSIVLICRRKSINASVTIRAEFQKALKRELPPALKLLQHGNIAPVDMAQASIGPGMAIFTRYSKVLESDDRPMSVKTALQLINQALDEYLSEQEADYDADTRFAITWFETSGMEIGPYGTAETLATARGVSVVGVVDSGILEARAGNVRLLRREELSDDWDPATDKRLTIWECAQYLIRSLESEGEAAAADLLARLGSRGEVARDLAYRLYGICERKKWADEGRAYNGLVVAWPEISRLAAQAGAATGPSQGDLGV